MIPKQAIIFGGGYSVKKGLDLGLQAHLEGKFLINCNYSFLHAPGTFLTFLDHDYYCPTYAKNYPKEHPDIYNKLKELPLIIGIDFNNGLKEFLLPNTILLKRGDRYNREFSLEKGFYHKVLCGIFALGLASFLMDYEGTIFLLGFDETKRTKENFINHTKPHTHYYEGEINHSGIGKTTPYHKSNDRFLPFTKEKGLHIYNVSPNSNINSFTKIDYEQMFSLLNNEKINQNELREEIKKKLIF